MECLFLYNELDWYMYMSMCFIYLIHSRLCGIRTTEGLSEVDIVSISLLFVGVFYFSFGNTDWSQKGKCLPWEWGSAGDDWGWCDAPSLNSFQFVELQGGASLLAATKNLQLRNLNNDNPLGRKNVLVAWLQDLRRWWWMTQDSGHREINLG